MSAAITAANSGAISGAEPLGESELAARDPIASRSKLASSLAPLVANGASAVANTAAIFALSTAAGSGFAPYAASTAALILAYGTARSLLGEPLMLTQRDRVGGLPSKFPSVRSWALASLIVGVALSILAAIGVKVAGVDGVTVVTIAAVSALIFNDAGRHLGFSRGSAWAVAAADIALALITMLLWVFASSMTPTTIYLGWAAAALVAGVALFVHSGTKVNRDHGERRVRAIETPLAAWVKNNRGRTKWLTAEAVVVTAAVTLPLILVADSVAGPGRLLLSWFGFQQILFFAAYATASRNGMGAGRTASVLFSAGAAGSVIVGVGLFVLPTDLMTSLFGPEAASAQGWVMWFALAQIVNAAGNAAALTARLLISDKSSSATRLFRARLIFATVSTAAGTAGALTYGVGGYIAGFGFGAALYVASATLVLRQKN